MRKIINRASFAFSKRERKVLARAVANLPASRMIVVVESAYCGSHLEYGHRDEIVILSVPDGTVIPEELWTSHGTFDYPFGDPNVVGRLAGALAWYDAERIWIDGERFGTMTPYRGTPEMPAFFSRKG